MATLRVRIDEGSEAQPQLLWDSVWQPQKGFADWAVAGPSETGNIGGLQARAALHTAVIICLFSDKRLPENHPLSHLVEDGDRRGWFGDGIDVETDQGEAELGSWLWIFARSYLNEGIRKQVEAVALDALQPLLFQRVAVSIEVEAIAQFAINRCDLLVRLYGRDGERIYDQRFDDVWRQTTTSPKPLPFPAFEGTS